MRKMLLFSLHLSALLWMGTVHASVPTLVESSGATCDRLTAHGDDLTKPPAVAAVQFNSINETSALQACDLAQQENPAEPRYVFQYGRAALKAGQRNTAYQFYAKAGQMGHRLAVRQIEEMYTEEKDNQSPISASRWALFGARRGDPEMLKAAAYLICTKGIIRGAQAEVAELLLASKDFERASFCAQKSGDYRLILSVLTRGAAAGDAACLGDLGNAYIDGKYGMTQNFDKGLQFIAQAAAVDQRNGNTDGYNLDMANLARSKRKQAGGSSPSGPSGQDIMAGQKFQRDIGHQNDADFMRWQQQMPR